MTWKMIGSRRARGTAAMLLSSVLLTVPFGPAAQVASAQCADPRGNSYCQNNGQVTFTTPAGQAKPASQPCADPRGNAYCPGPASAQVIAPAPVQPARLGVVGVARLRSARPCSPTRR